MRPAILIYNPNSGRRRSARLLPKVLETLHRGGFDVQPQPTAGPDDATLLARAAARSTDPIEVVFAMGGDGTLREVAAGLLGSEVALGPIPCGTTNVFALALGLPRHALGAAAALPQCKTVAIDVGMVGEEPFLMLASCGLDAAVMAQQHGRFKRMFGKGAVAWLALEHWWKYGYPRIELNVQGHPEEASYMAVCNIPYYGGAFRLAPMANFSDRRLDLLLFRGTGRQATMSLALDVIRGRHLKRADLRVQQVEEVEVLGTTDSAIAPEAERGPAERGPAERGPAERGTILMQIDGDVRRLPLPVKLGLAAAQLRVLSKF